MHSKHTHTHTYNTHPQYTHAQHTHTVHTHIHIQYTLTYTQAVHIHTRGHTHCMHRDFHRTHTQQSSETPLTQHWQDHSGNIIKRVYPAVTHTHTLWLHHTELRSFSDGRDRTQTPLLPLEHWDASRTLRRSEGSSEWVCVCIFAKTVSFARSFQKATASEPSKVGLDRINPRLTQDETSDLIHSPSDSHSGSTSFTLAVLMTKDITV